MDTKMIFTQCERLGIVLEPGIGDQLVVHSPGPLPEVLRHSLRQHKAEILKVLQPQPPQWHAERIARAVVDEGLCLFWSDLFGEVIAFIKDNSYASAVPAGVVSYTVDEVTTLFSEMNRSPHTLRLTHEAKRHGGQIRKVKP